MMAPSIAVRRKSEPVFIVVIMRGLTHFHQKKFSSEPKLIVKETKNVCIRRMFQFSNSHQSYFSYQGFKDRFRTEQGHRKPAPPRSAYHSAVHIFAQDGELDIWRLDGDEADEVEQNKSYFRVKL